MNTILLYSDIQSIIGGYVAGILLIVHKTQDNQSFKVKQRNNSHPSFHNAYVILALK